MIVLSGLVAYPAFPPEIGEAIRLAFHGLHDQDRLRSLNIWEETDIAGKFIATEVMGKIDSGNVFIADITRLNFNVLFEIGYAIGRNKRTILIRNSALVEDRILSLEVGTIDTLGYKNYTDSKTLTTLITELIDFTPLHFDKDAVNQATPVFMVLPGIKGDAETRLIARIKKARLTYRSFDPQEHGSLSAYDAIENVAMSYGVVIPLLTSQFKEARVHNLRAAFVAGLAKAMGKTLLLLQSGNDPVPMDYRDLVDRFFFPEQIDEHVSEFAPAIMASYESPKKSIIAPQKSRLQDLNLGASAAENEMIELASYYIQTDEYGRALHGDIQLVLGRKGTGKTALFFQLRDKLHENKRNVVLDLRPEGFQLLKFKEQVLDYLEVGTRDHTITAFWEYLLLLEICHKLLEKDQELHLRDRKLYESYQQLAAAYAADEYIAEGDFSERMSQLTQRIATDFEEKQSSSQTQRLRSGEITELLHKHDVAGIRKEIIEYLSHKSDVWILFDNLDKGWPPNGVTPEDVLSLRCLIDAMNTLKRDLKRAQKHIYCIVFIRNDVYDNLIAATSDRGKISYAQVDWTDPEMLIELLRRRFIFSDNVSDLPFDEIWRTFCVTHIRGEETAHYLIERCLMRPRALIELLRTCRAHAVNLRHDMIQVEDIVAGETDYSRKLVEDISFEILDVLPAAELILYNFLESPRDFSESDVLQRIKATDKPDGLVQQILELLLWHGVFGFRQDNGDGAYIYSYGYDMRKFMALIEKRKATGLVYMINPAFWKGLEIRV